MRRLPPGASVVAALVAAVVLVGGGLIPKASAANADPSNVVLVLDFSASILEDATTRNRFAAALRRIAARVDETSADLVAGDATVSIVQFATRAADYPTCVNLKLLNNPKQVAKFANCLRSVATAYRRGLTPALTKKIGVDTNYVAAMQRAATHLPADSIRPAMILFTDGKHDVRGVPVARVQTTFNQLFGSRSPFALLPVGMGLKAAERAALTAGLERLRVIRNMPACISGATFDWPQVTFQSADQAGNAVAVALQEATCTFTAAPTPPPTPSPTPAPTPGAVHEIRLTPGDGKIDLAWLPTAGSAIEVTDYGVRCRTGEGDWVESTEGVSNQPRATVEGLTNGVPYQCEVATISGPTSGAWIAAGTTAAPFGRPAPPDKPSVEADNTAIKISVGAAPSGAVSTYHYECSSDNGATWTAKADGDPDNPATSVRNVANGVTYVCRAFAQNRIGVSDASVVSDSVKPCAGFLDCTGLFTPVLGGLGVLLVGGILAAFIALTRGRVRGYVVAVVDVVHTANIGHGKNLGIAFVRDPNTKAVTGIVADQRSPDVRIKRQRNGRFVVRDKAGRREVEDGDPVGVTDGVGNRHSLVLRAFDTAPASTVTSRR